jgi:hypothetical protein
VKKPLPAEDAEDAKVHRGKKTMKTMDIDSLRVLCVLCGEDVLCFFHTFAAKDLLSSLPSRN